MTQTSQDVKPSDRLVMNDDEIGVRRAMLQIDADDETVMSNLDGISKELTRRTSSTHSRIIFVPSPGRRGRAHE